jgi:hypothetical protein
MTLLVLLVCREAFGFASQTRWDPLIKTDVIYQPSFGVSGAKYTPNEVYIPLQPPLLMG